MREVPKLTREETQKFLAQCVPNGVPVRFMRGGRCVASLKTGRLMEKGINIIYQNVYWNFTKETAKEIAKLINAKAVFSE